MRVRAGRLEAPPAPDGRARLPSRLVLRRRPRTDEAGPPPLRRASQALGRLPRDADGLLDAPRPGLPRTVGRRARARTPSERAERRVRRLARRLRLLHESAPRLGQGARLLARLRLE